MHKMILLATIAAIMALPHAAQGRNGATTAGKSPAYNITLPSQENGSTSPAFYREENRKDTVTVLSEVAVVAKMKQKNNLREESLSSTTIKLGEIERKQVVSLQDAAMQVPNLHIPNYGSRMTSSIYVRGLGSRIDHPAVGMYMDNIPYLNKNGFDTDLWDIMRIEVLRGPQSTLYGRNTTGGIINIYTLSPMVYQGARISTGYSSGNTYTTKGSLYIKPSEKFAFSWGANYLKRDGFFTNEYTGEKCDREESATGRLKLIYKPTERLTIENTFAAGKVDQGGYAYRLHNPAAGTTGNVNYNDICGYERTTLSNGLSISYKGDRHTFSSVTAWQYLDDCMTLDQDFTPASMFTMQQAQHENTFTQDFIMKRSQESRMWQWLTGVTLFYKDMEMKAPVRFRQDGINALILGNINGIFQGMPAPMNTAKLQFAQDEFDLNSTFYMPVLGAAMYHQSQFNIGKFTLTAGLRLDYEKAKLDYLSNSQVDYIYSMKIQMNPMMPPTEVKVESGVSTVMADKLTESWFEVLPKFALQYSMEEKGNLYASVSRGFKAGGYNTQIFSDILQNRLKSDLMADLMDKAGGASGSMGGGMQGGNTTTSYSVDETITYKPEYSWNWEAGAHLTIGRFTADAALFYINCTDQQLTVFPDGNTTGRMMTNAGKSVNKGVELALNGQITQALHIGASYGYTSAKFKEYNDGINDYSNNHIPYVPQNTLNANASYTFWNVGKLADRLQLRIGYNGIGKTYWDEANLISQKYYQLLNASVYVEKGKFSVELWSKNLTDTSYNAFYFVSVGNAFFSQGRPAEYGITVNFEL